MPGFSAKTLGERRHRDVACAGLQGQTWPQGLYTSTAALEHQPRSNPGQSALAALPAYLGQAPKPSVFVENAKNARGGGCLTWSSGG